jgi:hypothetical protein
MPVAGKFDQTRILIGNNTSPYLYDLIMRAINANSNLKMYLGYEAREDITKLIQKDLIEKMGPFLNSGIPEVRSAFQEFKSILLDGAIQGGDK